MSPEQVRSPGGVDSRADIWSLGVVLYQLTSGEVPFNAETLPALSLAIASDEHRPLAELLDDAPPEFTQAVERCLSKNRDERFSNVAELAASIEPFGPPATRGTAERCARVFSEGVEELGETQPMTSDPATLDMSAPASPADLGTQTGVTAPAEADTPPPNAQRSGKRFWYAALALGVAGGLAIFSSRGGDAPKQPPNVPSSANDVPEHAAAAPAATPKPEPSSAADAAITPKNPSRKPFPRATATVTAIGAESPGKRAVTPADPYIDRK